VPKMPFHCEREIGFTALGRRLLLMLRSRGDRPAIIRIGAKVARHACYGAFRIAEVAISKNRFAEILRTVANSKRDAFESN
jgi:hypothetical protein